jgi:hypothetical protein|tara:strand:- start:1835 stop:2194 length:360 start_codon:yes stop_codon:yes gene_type:complete
MTITEYRELSPEDKLYAFRKATNGFSQSEGRWRERAARGLTDEELKAALEFELGIYGGSGGPGEMSLAFQATGLKIWADWNTVVPDRDRKPIFQGAATIRMAREVYGIIDPTDAQMALL